MDLSQYQELLNSINSGNNSTQIDEVTTQVVIPSPSGSESLTFLVVNKTIQTPIMLSDVLVQGDTRSRKIHFVINRYFDGVDLSTKDIFMVYQNAELLTGYSDVNNLSITDDIIEFDWWIDSKVTILNGEIAVQIEICEHDEVGDVVYRYQTLPLSLEVKKTVIASGDAEPIDYYLQIKFLNEYSNPVNYDGMVSTTAPVEINNRTIIMPSLDDIAVTQDSRSRLITFKLKRYIDNIDLVEKTPCIKYKLLNGTGDRSFVCNQVVTDTHLQFDWLLDSKVTSIVGRVDFAIEFIGYNEKGEFYCFNTLPSYIFVQEGLDVDNIIEQPTASWMQSWNILAETYLRNYIEYIKQSNENAQLSMTSAANATLAMQKARASEISAENDAGIAWQQADRAERMANLTNGYKDSVDNTMKEFTENYSKFYDEYTNIRKKDEPITKADLSEVLNGIIDNKTEKGHKHNAIDVITNDDRQFVTLEQLNNLNKARLKTDPIKESDLSVEVVEKLNSGGTGGDSGGNVSGAEIDDTAPSFSKVYSSKKTEDKINNAVQGAITGIGGRSDNNFTDEEKLKLSRIEDNANYFTITTLSASIIDETGARKFVSPTEKENFLDKYTKSEVDNMFSKVTSGLVWKPEVNTFNDIATTYPNPIKDWAVSIANGDTYLYDGEAWIKIGSGRTPLATKESSGLLSDVDKRKLDGIEAGANKYTHPTTHSASMITETNDKRFISAIQEEKLDNIDTTISDALKDYRINTVKIKETDLDQEFLDKVANAGGTVINDEMVSTTRTYSSSTIENKITDTSNILDEKIDEVVADIATVDDINVYFSLW